MDHDEAEKKNAALREENEALRRDRDSLADELSSICLRAVTDYLYDPVRFAGPDVLERRRKALLAVLASLPSDLTREHDARVMEREAEAKEALLREARSKKPDDPDEEGRTVIWSVRAARLEHEAAWFRKRAAEIRGGQ